MSKSSRKSTRAHAETPVVAEAPVETPVVETPVVEAAPAAETAKVAKIRYAKRDWAPTDVITLNVANTKHGASFHRFALYHTGMTVAEYAAAVVGLGGKNTKTLANADLRWDVARNFISIAPAAKEEA